MLTFDELFNPFLRALKELWGSGTVEETYAKTVEIAGIREDIARMNAILREAMLREAVVF